MKDETAPKQPEFAMFSAFLSVVAGVVAIGAGIYLAGLDSVGGNSLMAAGENGIGWYCIAKGLYMAASPFQLRGAVRHLFVARE